MKNLEAIFGQSPFELMVAHARKVHECVALVRPVAESVLAGDLRRIQDLQQQMSGREYEADQLRTETRKRLSRRLFLSAEKEDLINFVRQLDRMGDDAEAFAVVSTYRVLKLPGPLHAPFLQLVDKVVELSDLLLRCAEMVAQLEKEAFEGREAKDVLTSIEQVCHMEWETDRMGQELARLYFSSVETDAVTILLLERMCKALLGVADHADNVGRSLRLMIARR